MKYFHAGLARVPAAPRRARRARGGARPGVCGRARRRRPGRPVSAPGSGGAAPAAPLQARRGQVQVAAQEGGGGGASRPRPYLLPSAFCAEFWDRSTGVVCLHKHHQPPELTRCAFLISPYKLRPPRVREKAGDLASPPFCCISGRSLLRHKRERRASLSCTQR